MKHQRLADFQSYQFLLDEIKQQLNDITSTKIYEEKQTKLIIMVDEIDRCLPDEQLMVLERLHHLFEVNSCAVIVAVNQNSIAATVHTLYGIKGYEYLRKFFDFTFKLLPSVEKLFENLLKDILKNINSLKELKGDFEGAAKSAYYCLLYGSEKAIYKIDNRDLKRYNDDIQEVINQFGWEKLTPNYLFFIIIGLFIREFISANFLENGEIYNNQNSVFEEL